MQNEVISKLTAYREEIEALGVENLRLFGSFARGTEHADSDVDVLAIFKKDARPGIKVVRLHRRLEEILGRPVDLLRAPVSNPGLENMINQDGIDAFKKIRPQGSKK